MKIKRPLCRALLLLALGGPLQSAQFDLGSPASRTPYDNYLGPVYKVFQQLADGQPDASVVEQLVRQDRAFRYYFNKDQPYIPQAPEVTDATKTGDCKAKSLWLAYKMNCRRIRFVIGKLSLGSPKSHAWLVWDSPQGWLVLDATNYSKPLVPDRISSSELVPTFSYAPGGGKFLHAMAAGGGAKYGDHL